MPHQLPGHLTQKTQCVHNVNQTQRHTVSLCFLLLYYVTSVSPPPLWQHPNGMLLAFLWFMLLCATRNSHRVHVLCKSTQILYFHQICGTCYTHATWIFSAGQGMWVRRLFSHCQPGRKQRFYKLLMCHRSSIVVWGDRKNLLWFCHCTFDTRPGCRFIWSIQMWFGLKADRRLE